MKNKILLSILGVAVISLIAFGSTYAYLLVSAEDTISGDIASGLTSTLVFDEVYKATNLVPLNDNLVSTAISKSSNKCVDKNGYEVCSLYKLTLSNSSASENLYGYVRTSNSSYITDNLKYQVFDSSYNAVTDVMTVSKDIGTTVYFQKDSSNYTTSSNGYTVYYLAIWLHETGDFQDDDYSKEFSGYVGFEAIDHFGFGTGRIEAKIGDEIVGSGENLISHITNLYLNNKDATLVTNNGIEYRYASIYIKDNDTVTSGGLMNDRDGSMEVGEDNGNIRYYGKNPNNYIYFNCSDYSNQSDATCEKWRIIGIVDGKVKIINDGTTNTAWDENMLNNWDTATLKTYLNGDYYKSLKTKNLKTVDLISKSTWYLGGYSSSNGLYANDIYKNERMDEVGTTIYGSNPSSIQENIGLMYGSDYGYATDLSVCKNTDVYYYSNSQCYDTNWLYSDTYQWLITPRSKNALYAWAVYGNGRIDYNGVNYDYGVRPVLYLNTELGIESHGDGTEGNPYRISVGTPSGAVNMVYFTIDGTRYSMEEGMTWAEWCDSDYNTIDLRVMEGENNNNYVVTSDDYYLQYNGSIIEGETEIMSHRDYIKYVQYGYVPYYFTLQIGRIAQSATSNYITSTIANRVSYVGTGVKLIPGARYKLVGVSGMRYGVQTITKAGYAEIQAMEYLTTANKLDSGWQTSGYTFTANANAAVCWLTASKSDNSNLSPNDAMPVYIQRIS